MDENDAVLEYAVRYDAGMFRRLVILASATSLLLSVAAAGMWVRSHRANDVLEWRGIESGLRLPHDPQSYWALFGYEIHSAGGELALAVRQITPYGDSAPPANDAELVESVGIYRGFFADTVTDVYGSAKTYGYTDAVHRARGGFGFYLIEGGPEEFSTVKAVCVPYWAVGMLAGVLPLARLWLVCRARRRLMRRGFGIQAAGGRD